MARGELANDYMSNGELLVQQCVLSAWRTPHVGAKPLVIFDVGANVGEWSAGLLRQLAAANMTGTADIYAFEPAPSTFESLKRGFGTREPSLHIAQLALSSSDGEGFIHIRGQNAGTNSLHAESANGTADLVKIHTRSATSFCQTENIQHVALLKCDTEGHDMEVVRGALPLLVAEKISVLQFEYNHRWVYARNFLRDVFMATEQLPYTIAKLQADHLLIFTEWHPELEKFFEGNYALVHADALTWFPTKTAEFDRFNTMTVTTR